MTDDGSIPLQIIIAILAFIFSSLFAYSEYSLDSLNDSELRKNSDSGASKKFSRLLKISQNDTDYIEAMHFGRLLSLFVCVIAGMFAVYGRVTEFAIASQLLAVAGFWLFLTLLCAVFVYIIPRHLAGLNPVKSGMMMVNFISFFRILFLPFVRISFYISKFLLAVFRVRIGRTPEKITEDSIISLVNEGQESGVIGDEESEMISNIFNLDDKTAGDVMTHRTEICAVSLDDSLDKILDVACSERYSRIPVYKDTIDDISGIIHIKDLLRADASDFSIASIIREATFVPESQKLDEVFDVLRSSSTHLAVVVDEYGGTAGIVTMEDILEELVGNIRDEYDSDEVITEKEEITNVGPDEYLIAGLTSIETVNEQLDISIPDDEFGTMSGFLIGILGQIPEENSHPEADFNNLHFRVEESNDRIITFLRLTVRRESDAVVE